MNEWVWSIGGMILTGETEVLGEATGGMIVIGETEVLVEEHAQVPLCPS